MTATVTTTDTTGTPAPTYVQTLFDAIVDEYIHVLREDPAYFRNQDRFGYPVEGNSFGVMLTHAEEVAYSLDAREASGEPLFEGVLDDCIDDRVAFLRDALDVAKESIIESYVASRECYDY